MSAVKKPMAEANRLSVHAQHGTGYGAVSGPGR